MEKKKEDANRELTSGSMAAEFLASVQCKGGDFPTKIEINGSSLQKKQRIETVTQDNGDGGSVSIHTPTKGVITSIGDSPSTSSSLGVDSNNNKKNSLPSVS